MTKSKVSLYVLAIISTFTLTACNESSSQSEDNALVAADSDDQTVESTTNIGLKPALFLDGALADEITTQTCTLSGGTETTCYRITIKGEPASASIGPFCPPHITSDDTEGGIWFDGNGEIYSVDGEFIQSLSSLYGSDWQLYDPETGNVKITDTQIACEAAAQPDVDPEYQNHCVECSIEYTNGGVEQTFLIPVEPVSLSNADAIGHDNIGVTLNGVVLAPPAPVQAILSANTIAAFDDCGGHVNPFEGYHYHAATGCTEETIEEDGHAGLIGYAIDGYAIYAMRNAQGDEDEDLDECRGHSDETRGYHYHAASAAENMFIGCFMGEQGEIIEE